MKHYAGARAKANDPMLSRAYCEGRKVAIDGGANSAPHPANTPEALAWARGWRSYVTGRTTVLKDCCGQDGLLTFPPTITQTVEVGDNTNLTVSYVSSPVYPITYMFDDGEIAFHNQGTVIHKFATYGDHAVNLDVYGLITSITTTTVEP